MYSLEIVDRKEPIITFQDFPFICRVCLNRSDLRLFQDEEYLWDLFHAIRNTDVSDVKSSVDLPKNICNECINKLEEISLFIDISKCNDKKMENQSISKRGIEYAETIGRVDKLTNEGIPDERKEDSSLQKVQNCRICSSTSTLTPFQQNSHLMYLFQNLTGVFVKTGINQKNFICSTCLHKLEMILSFISLSVCSDEKLENVIVRSGVKTETTSKVIENESSNCSDSKLECAVGKKKGIDKHSLEANALIYKSKEKCEMIDIKEENIDIELSNSVTQSYRSGVKFQSRTLQENTYICEKSFTRADQLTRQLIIRLEVNSFKYNFNETKIIRNNISQRHWYDRTDEDCFQCYHCGKKYKRKPYLIDHLHIHSGEKRFGCDNCENRFITRGALKLHMRIHTKAFKCDICEKGFLEKDMLRIHLLLHTGGKPFQCVKCKKTFRSKKYLSRHLRDHTREKQFKCDICEKKFFRRCTLQLHQHTHTGERPFECGNCQRRFIAKSSLRLHLQTHKKEKPFKCDSCDRSFFKKGLLLQHSLRSHIGEKPFECGNCERKFFTKSEMKVHLRTHTGEKPFSCDSCEKRFALKSSLNLHLFSHKDEKPHKCDHCKRSFSVFSTLSQHLRIHSGEKPFKCEYCQEGFRTKEILKYHVRHHTGERAFKCDICKKRFTTNAVLKVHRRTHTKDKPFKCDICGNRFSRNHVLQRHIFTHTGEKPFKCDICDRRLVAKSELKLHMRTHTGNKQFKCGVCGSSFYDKCPLKRHMRVHTGEKPFKCDNCEKSFAQFSALRVHLRIHTGEKPFKCEYCEKRFSTNGGLQQHLSRMHTEEKHSDAITQKKVE